MTKSGTWTRDKDRIIKFINVESAIKFANKYSNNFVMFVVDYHTGIPYKVIVPIFRSK